jgi:hypothetical protein
MLRSKYDCYAWHLHTTIAIAVVSNRTADTRNAKHTTTHLHANDSDTSGSVSCMRSKLIRLFINSFNAHPSSSNYAPPSQPAVTYTTPPIQAPPYHQQYPYQSSNRQPPLLPTTALPSDLYGSRKAAPGTSCGNQQYIMLFHSTNHSF